jgi:hypothetical protein
MSLTLKVEREWAGTLGLSLELMIGTNCYFLGTNAYE